ncbi:MAG: RNA 2',3'-cyclic phosphodiesterase [Bacteroidetes bacterium]|nr:RNA 2',3'-cyclic phosphodiesterase [Bacteroidota bacterium]
MKRLFAAIKITPDKGFLDKYHHLQSQLRYEKIKWVEDLNIHITLKFFGETEEKKIAEINQALQMVADQTRAFQISLTGLGIFGSSYNPKVIWTGIQPYVDLVEIMKRTQNELKSCGYEPDRQNLVPHLTLGRVKFLSDKQLFQRTIDEYKEIGSTPIKPVSFHLFESILKKEGPTYIILKTFNFKY